MPARNRPVTTRENYRQSEPRVSISYQPVPNDIEKPAATRYRQGKKKIGRFFRNFSDSRESRSPNVCV